MADPRFFDNRGPFSLGRLAEIGLADLHEAADPALMISDVAPLSTAGQGEVSFLDNPKYVAQFRESRAQACIIAPKFAGKAPEGMALLLSANPYKSYALIAQAFYPRPEFAEGVAQGACVAASASLGQGTHVAAGAWIGEGVEIGPQSYIGPNSVIGDHVKIGSHGWIAAQVSISHALIGDRVSIHPGARIGQDGFGFAPDPAGFVKVPQLGRVIIQDDCDIGANTTIDRGTGPDTVIGEGSWIDNLVQIGHNVKIGRRCIIAALAGLSGSVEVEDFVQIGGQSGFAGHLHVGSGAQIAAQAGVMRDVAPGQRMVGTPAVPAKQFFREVAMISRLADRKRQTDE